MAYSVKNVPNTSNDPLPNWCDSWLDYWENKKGQKYYFIYLPNSKQAYLYPAKRGVSEAYIKNKFKTIEFKEQF